MTEVFGFIGVMLYAAFFCLTALAGLGIIGLLLYALGALPFIIANKLKDSSKES